MKRIPSHDETLDALGQFKNYVYECIEKAITATNQHYVANSDHSVDRRRLYSLHVREKFLEFLRLETERYGFSIEDGPGDSFSMIYGFFTIRFYKAFNGKLPLSRGDSSLEDFCKWNSQFPASRPVQVMLPLPGFESDKVRELMTDNAVVNLIIYYDVDIHHNLAWLKVACPKNARRSVIETFWDTLIENPLAASNEELRVKRSTKERKDLPFTLRTENSSTEMG